MGRVDVERHCVGGTCKSFTRLYDTLDRLETLIYPPTAMKPVGEMLTYGYDDAGNLDSVSDYVTNMEWSPAGQLESIQYANGTQSSYTYDPNRQWLKTANVMQTLSLSSLYSAQYEYDNAGRVDWMKIQRPGAPAPAVWDYAYDELNRLTSLSGTAGAPSEGYDHDPVGNLMSKGALGAYQYADGAHPQAVTQIGLRSYVYDANGSLTEKRTCSIADCSAYTTDVSYDFDAEARLASVTKHSPSSVTTFKYAPDGERVRAQGPSGDRRFYGALLETNGSQETVFYYAGPIRVAMRSVSVGVRFYHHDHLGSVRLVTDAVGNAAGSYDFLPYGTKMAGTGSPDPVWDFAGHRTDSDTGLVYMNARYYDPEIGRFLSADTIVPDPINSQSLNRYSYVNNNPISNIDPSGHSGQGLGIALTVISAFVSGFTGIPLVMAGAWLGAGLSVAGVATRNPYLAAAGAIVLGFVGGYAGGLPFVSGVAGGVLGGTVGYLVSPVSPVSTDVQVAIGWALTAYGVLRPAESAARYAADKLADQISELASGLGNAGVWGRLGRGVAMGVGYVWNAPNTALGLIFGGVGHVVGEIGYALGLTSVSPSISFGNNAIQFLNNPFTPSAITIGNVSVYGPGSSPGATNIHFANTPAGFTVGAEEMRHTYQGMITGPLYLLLHVAGGVTSIFRGPHSGLLHPVDLWHQNNFMETGPMQGRTF